MLQDVHWPGGAFGYFPTYSLGNVIAGQLWEAAARDIDGLDERIGSGDLAPLGEWLREKVHRHGRRLSPAQILEGAGCGALSVEPLLEHLRAPGSVPGLRALRRPSMRRPASTRLAARARRSSGTRSAAAEKWTLQRRTRGARSC